MINIKLPIVLMSAEGSTFLATIILGWVLLADLASSCTGFRFLGVTLILIGVAMLVFFYMGCSLFMSNPDAALAKSLCCSVPMFIAMATLGIFALSVSSQGGGTSIRGRSYKEYHVQSYSIWMQDKVNDISNWENYYKKAVVKEHVCHKFAKEYRRDSLDVFHKRKLSAYESGCCKPSEDCNFNYISPANWVKPDNGTTYSNIDCNRWDNNPQTLCYNCESCKAAFLDDATSHWYWIGVVLVIFMVKHILMGINLICTVLVNPHPYQPLA